MAEEMKEKDPAWVPHTPTKFPSEPEIKNNGVSDTKGEEVDGSSKMPRKKRMKMTKHRPKVVNESKPLKPLTPKPRTPKLVKRKPPKGKLEKNELPVKRKAPKRKLEKNESEKEDDDGEDGHGCRKLVCRRELKFDEDRCDKKNGIVTKKRSIRQRISISKLIRLVGIIHDKCMCESRVLNLTCINLRRKRSRIPTIRRKDLSVFLPIGPQVQLVDDQCELFSPDGNGNGNGPQVQLVDDQCEHQGDAFSPHGNVDTCSAKLDIIQGDVFSGNGETCSAELDIIQGKVSDDAFKEALVDYATQKLEALQLVDQMSGALQVVDQKIGAMQVVNQNYGALRIVDPKHRRAKVVLDEETLRVWKLLTIKEEGEATDTDTDNVSPHLAKERELFTTLVKAFNTMMSGLTGNRRFSRWKGSVVDSIVGVFLTQNVGDNLSSNAFMALAAKYPPPPIREQNGCIDRIDYMVSESQEGETNEPGKSKESDSNNRVELHVEHNNKSSRKEKEKVKNEEKQINWDELRKKYSSDAKRGDDYADFIDWEAVKRASEEEIAKVIEERGMSNQLAKRIKNFLDRLVRDHGSMDLEWLRNTPPDKVKEYLLSIDGLGLKSTECVRLLSLLQRAFPVDVNAARVLVRVGWVQLQPLPDGLPIHLLNDYPELGSVQKFMWPRICHLDELILYEYHCYLNIFSKSFCTKTNPNCNACPMKGDCKHYASALASSRLHLEDSRDKDMSSERNQKAAITNGSGDCNSDGFRNEYNSRVAQPIVEFPPSPGPTSEPIIEFPPSPGPASAEPLGGDIEDFGTQIPTIVIEELSNNLSNVVKDDVSKAVVALDPRGGSIPMPKLKYVERLRTLLLVYVLPDWHPLLAGFEKRELEDPCPYLLAIYDQESEELKKVCKCVDSQGSTTCGIGACSSEIVEYKQNDNIKGTILIPCRTANRGGFPLNGTYFQINEVFADHESSGKPIDVPRALIWNLDKRILYCGTSITSICRGMSLKQVACCFQRGYICIRGFDLKTRRPKPLAQRFHFCKTRQSN